MSTLFPLALCGQIRAQIDPAALLQQARAKILENIRKLPNYTCIQTVRRSQFETLSGERVADCSQVEKAGGGKGQSRLLMASADRFKLDVTISKEGEIFSWAGARKFESTDAQEIVGSGLTGTGDFGGFLGSIFGGGAAEYQYLGLEQIEGRDFAAYRYQVPISSSHYRLKIGPRSKDLAMMAYEGKFWIDPRNATLSRMTIIVPQPPVKSQMCRIETTIEYQPFQIGGARLLLPQLTLLKVWDTDGTRSENRSAYASCRAFQSESVFRPDVAPFAGDPASGKALSVDDSAPVKTPLAIPSGSILQIALRSKIDSESAFAGDPIEGQLLQAIRDRCGNILASPGTVVHGRIVRFEQHYAPSSYFALGLKYYSLVVNGSEVPLTLEPIPQSPGERDLTGSLEKRQGIGMFMFQSQRLALDDTFVSEWKTKKAKTR